MPDNIEENKNKMIASLESLYECCEKINNTKPELNMTLREFISTYGWQGIYFKVWDTK